LFLKTREKKFWSEELHSTIIEGIDLLHFGEKELPGKKVVPKITAAEVEALLPQAEKY